MKWKLAFSVLVILLSAGACSKSSNNIAKLGISASSQTMPCWRNLCIGQVADNKQLGDLLNAIVGVSDVSISTEVNKVDFIWRDIDGGFTIYGTAAPYMDRLQGLALQPSIEIPISAFIDKYGEPGCVSVLDTMTNTKAVTLRYPDQGITLELAYIDNNVYEYINADMSIVQIGLVPITESDGCISQKLYRTYSWQGFSHIYP